MKVKLRDEKRGKMDDRTKEKRSEVGDRKSEIGGKQLQIKSAKDLRDYQKQAKEILASQNRRLISDLWPLNY